MRLKDKDGNIIEDILISKNKVLLCISELQFEAATKDEEVDAATICDWIYNGVEYMVGNKPSEDSVSREDVYKMFRSFALRNDSTYPDTEIQKLVNSLPAYSPGMPKE